MTVEINFEKLSLQTKLALAKERELDKTIQEMLARDDSEQVKIALIHNASTSEEILTKFLEEDENLIEELKRNSRIVKKFENLLKNADMMNAEDAITIAKLHDVNLDRKLCSTMQKMMFKPWFRDVIDIWETSDIYWGMELATQFIYLLPIEKQKLTIYACVDGEQMENIARNINNKEAFDIIISIMNMRKPEYMNIPKIQMALIDNCNIIIKDLAKEYLIKDKDNNADMEVLKEIARRATEEREFLKLLRVENEKNRKAIIGVISSRKEQLPQAVYSVLSRMSDSTIREKAILDEIKYYMRPTMKD